MKFWAFFFFVIYLAYAWSRPIHAAEINHTSAYCSGYANTMAKTYRLRYYYQMSSFYQYSANMDSLSAEYYQSGTESVKITLPLPQNLNSICENGFNPKGK